MQASTWTDVAGTFISSPSSKSCVIIQPLFHEFFIAAAFSPKCKMEVRLPALHALLSVLILLRLKRSCVICGYCCFFRGEDACQDSIGRGEGEEGRKELRCAGEWQKRRSGRGLNEWKRMMSWRLPMMMRRIPRGCAQEREGEVEEVHRHGAPAEHSSRSVTAHQLAQLKCCRERKVGGGAADGEGGAVSMTTFPPCKTKII